MVDEQRISVLFYTLNLQKVELVSLEILHVCRTNPMNINQMQFHKHTQSVDSRLADITTAV